MQRPACGKQDRGKTSKAARATLLHFPATQDARLLVWRMAGAGTGPSEDSPGLCRDSPEGLQCGLSRNCGGGGDSTSPPPQPCPQGVTVGTALPL